MRVNRGVMGNMCLPLSFPVTYSIHVVFTGRVSTEFSDSDYGVQEILKSTRSQYIYYDYLGGDNSLN